MYSEKSKTLSSKIRDVLNKIYSVDHRKWAKPLAIILFSLIPPIVLVPTVLKTKSVDYYAFLTGASLLLNNKENLYDIPSQYKTQERLFEEGYTLENGFMAFVSLPISAFVYTPFLLFPQKITAEAVQVISFLIIIYCIFRLYRFHNVKFVSWVTVSVSYFYPLYAAAHLGQIGMFILIVLTEMYLAFVQRKTVRLGILASLLILKFQYLTLIPLIFAVYPERKKFFKTTAIGLVLLLFITFALAGFGWIEQYMELIKAYVANPRRYGMAYMYGLDVTSLALNLAPSADKTQLFLTILPFLAATQIIVFSVLLKNRQNYVVNSITFSFILIFCLLISPHTMPADFVFLLVPLISILAKTKSLWLGVPTIFCLGLLFFYSVFGHQLIQITSLVIYDFVLFLTMARNPGNLGRLVRGFMVGDPGIEPGTARV